MGGQQIAFDAPEVYLLNRLGGSAELRKRQHDKDQDRRSSECDQPYSVDKPQRFGESAESQRAKWKHAEDHELYSDDPPAHPVRG